MSEHTYHLQKYAGTSTRHTCPQCGHKGEFTYYVDERNVPIDESCGRCNRERCGYHLTPSEYFKLFADSRHTRPINEMSLPHGNSRNHLKQFPYLIYLLRCWQQIHTETETIYSSLCLKSSEMLRQTGCLISTMSGRLATGETVTDYLQPFHRLTKKANYAN